MQYQKTAMAYLVSRELKLHLDTNSAQAIRHPISIDGDVCNKLI